MNRDRDWINEGFQIVITRKNHDDRCPECCCGMTDKALDRQGQAGSGQEINRLPDGQPTHVKHMLQQGFIQTTNLHPGRLTQCGIHHRLHMLDTPVLQDSEASGGIGSGFDYTEFGGQVAKLGSKGLLLLLRHKYLCRDAIQAGKARWVIGQHLA